MGDADEKADGSALPSEALEKGLARAFEGSAPRAGESALGALERLTGVRSRIHLPEAQKEDAPVVRVPGQDDPELSEPDSRYEVLGEIARGGVGVVFRSRDRDLGRDVAIKVLRRDLAAVPEVVQRFVEEAQIGGQLQHPGVVPVYGLGIQSDGRPYFAMKLVKGRTLGALIRDGEDRTTLMSIFERVCQTTAYAHARHVIHRDLKPSNVLVGSYGEVQVVDWGFAKVLAHGGNADEQAPDTPLPDLSIIETIRTKATGSESQVGSLLGTPPYMPPEQARGDIEHLDERTDVFALGAVLCEILTGKPPYTGGPREVVIQAAGAKLDDAYARLDSSGADTELVTLAKQCLTASRQARPRHAGAVAEAVAAWRRSLDEKRRRAELDAAAAKRTRKLTVGLATAIVLALLTGGAAFYIVDAAERSRRERADGMVETALREAHLRYGEARSAPLEDREAWQAAEDAASKARDLAAQVGAGTGVARDATTHLEAVEAAARAAETEAAARAAHRALVANLRETRWRYAGWAAYPVRKFEPEARASLQQEVESALAGVLGPAGLDPHSTAPAEVATRLEPLRSADDVVRTLDLWLALRRRFGGDTNALRRTLLLADDDPIRTRIRELAAREDADGLTRLAEEPDALPDPTIDLLVTLLRNVERTETALQVARARRARNPRHVDAAFHFARLLLDAKPRRDREALPILRDIVREVPESAAAHATLGYAQVASEGREPALLSWRRARQLAPDAESYRRLFLGLALKVQAERFARGDYHEAAELCREVVEVAPDRVGWHGQLAIALHAQRKLTEALEAADRAVELAPDRLDGHYARAVIFEASRNLDEALAAVRQARQREPVPGRSAIVHGRILGRIGERERALEVFGAVQGRRRWLAQLYTARVLYALGRFEACVKATQEGLKLGGGASLNWLEFLARAQRAAGDTEGWRQTRQRILGGRHLKAAQPSSTASDPFVDNHKLGMAAGAFLDEQEADAWYAREFADAEPKQRAAYLTGVAWSRWLHRADADGALRILRRAHDVDSTYPALWSRRAEILDCLGRDAEALEAFERAAELQNKSWAPTRELAPRLTAMGRWDAAIAVYERVRQGTGWGAEQIQDVEGMKAIDAELPAIAAGEKVPADWREAFRFAAVAQARRHYLLAARLWREHVARIPADKPGWFSIRTRMQGLFFATAAALRAAAGEGADAADLSAEDRERLRRRGLEHAAQVLDTMEEGLRYVDGWETSYDSEMPFLKEALVHPTWKAVRDDPELGPRMQALWERWR